MSLRSVFGTAPLLGLVFAKGLPAVAQAVEPISLVQVAPASLRLRIANPAGFTGYLQVVRLSTGQSLFTEAYTTSAYGHRFDFDRAPSGRYLVWLQLGPARYRYTVRVKTQAAQSTACVHKLAIQYYPPQWPSLPTRVTLHRLASPAFIHAPGLPGCTGTAR